MDEIWKDIPGYEGRYQASTFGNIRETATGRVLPQHSYKTKGDKYYMRCGFDKKGFIVHRLIALTFIPNPENKPQVDHIDFNEQNNRVDNLRWVTSKENQIHSGPRMIKMKQGQNHPRALFTDEDVIAIRELRRRRVKYRVIAEMYGVKENTICSMITRRWKHLS